MKLSSLKESAARRLLPLPAKSNDFGNATSIKSKTTKKKPREPAKNGDLKAKCRKIDTRAYDKELARLQIELVNVQEWVKHGGLRVVVVFKGRDAAGKGGAIKRITESPNPRICRVVALGRPTEREKNSWYFQRYVPHLPARGRRLRAPSN